MHLAFVTPRYGTGVVGGAEAQLREMARGLAARGHEVTVLTTCALDAATWSNEAPSGISSDSGVEVRRFETVPNPDGERRDALDHRVLGGPPLSAAEELAWVASRYESPGMARHVAQDAGRYDAIVFAPYLAWTTLHCLPLAAGRSVLVPCLHDEPAARLGAVRAVLAGAAEVWFNSEPEHELAHRLVTLGPHRTVGDGVDVPERYDPEGFRRRHGLRKPFVLYAGRREDGKGWPGALAGLAVATGRLGLDLDLVSIGAGDAAVPGHLASRVSDLGYLDVTEVPDAFAAAVAHVQPSTLESFSRTIMESWLAGTVVVGNAAGPVVSWHCERSGGGLLYGDELEMAECLRLVLDTPGLADAMAARGRRYVLEACTWPPVLDRIEDALDGLLGRGGPRGTGGEGGATGAGAAAGGAQAHAQAQVRARAAAARLDGLASVPAVPLGEWLPAPGAGVPPAPVTRDPRGWMAVRRAAAGEAGRAGARRLGRSLVRSAERRSVGRGLVRGARALRAARRAWASGAEPVAPPRDVR